MLEKVEGVIIRTQNYGETHLIATLLTDKLGKIGVLARGAKKPRSRMAAVTQLFIHGEYLVRLGRGLSILEQGDVVNSHRKIREDIFLTAYASYLAELTNVLVDEKQPNYYVYQQLLLTLQGITDFKDPLVLTLMYEMKLYNVAGFAPTIDRCQNCQRTDQINAFSIKEAGVLCQRCLAIDPNHRPINQTQYKLLKLFSEIDMNRVANINVKAENKEVIRQILEQYYETYGGLTLKSRKFLKQIHLLK
ncbi:DNA repair protein RecO [Amphibacillus xylanus]|uniref:DNA repair protein RecO n=1 Tax=Amphibacillus xylanus (strain ATCC 51415 / DSM 6626 / JCM 7361 / LMG 17667 / NBRC 15112 / Ep01) TaxID=698758 RepID=K0J7B5_AMPXN|nr:DNA repair protein RecO [Amphibacillus xylanus]BAM47248.1 DNA repair protein RecO [Amphibacillus xylanus NBRC 15112]